MMRQVMEAAHLSQWPTLSLVIFFAMGVGVLAWVYRTGSRDTYARMGRLALDENEEVR